MAPYFPFLFRKQINIETRYYCNTSSAFFLACPPPSFIYSTPRRTDREPGTRRRLCWYNTVCQEQHLLPSSSIIIISSNSSNTASRVLLFIHSFIVFSIQALYSAIRFSVLATKVETKGNQRRCWEYERRMLALPSGIFDLLLIATPAPSTHLILSHYEHVLKIFNDKERVPST